MSVRLGLFTGLCLVVAGCADDSGSDPGPGDPPSCTAPKVACGDFCVNLQTNAAHCGACGNTCGPAGLCVEGVCAASACEDPLLPGPALAMGIDKVWRTAVGDLDGDEIPDLVVGGIDAAGNGTFLLPGRGDGTFGPLVELARTGPAAQLRIANLDGSGLPDVVTTGNVDGQQPGLTLLLRDLAGAVATQHLEWRIVTGLGVADLDGDGDLDVIASAVTGIDVSAVRILRNDDGAFSWDGPEVPVAGRVADFSAGDRDGDGDLDLLGPGDAVGLGYWENLGNLDFQKRWTVPLPLAVIDIATTVQADLDRDGDLDAVTSGPTILRNDGTGAVTIETIDLGGLALGLDLADVDADGDRDLLAVVRDADGRTVRLVRNQNGDFAPGPGWEAPHGAIDVFAVDLDGDGAIDALTAEEFGPSIEVLPGGGGTFRGRVHHPLDVGIQAWVSLADLAGDGRLDAVYVGETRLGVVSDVSPGGVGAGESGLDLPSPRGLAVGDLDGDGLPERVTAIPAEGTVRLVPGHGPATTIAVAEQPLGVAIGDLDGDGNAELLVAHGGDSPHLSVRWGRAFQPDSAYTLIERPEDVVVGDVDGDGRDEAVVATHGFLQLIAADETGGLASAGLVDARTMAPSLADLDGDGRVELLAPDYLENHLLVFRVEGGGPVLVTRVTTGATPLSVIGADFDRDGRTDLAVSDLRGHVELFRGAANDTFVAAGAWIGDGDQQLAAFHGTALAAADLDADGWTDLVFVGAGGMYVLGGGCLP